MRRYKKRGKTWRKSSKVDRDRISKLPDEILVTILSRLWTEEAVRTSILSSRWRTLWKHTTTLDFDSKKHLGDADQPGFFSWMNQVLESHEAPRLQKLRIRFRNTGKERVCDFLGWLQAGANRMVQEFDLKVLGPRPWILRVSHFPDSGLPNFNSVRKLSLDRLHVFDQTVNDLLSKCPCLEFLRLADSNILVNLIISSDSLKSLEISECLSMRSLEISACNLVSVTYDGPVIEFNLKKVPRLVEVSFFDRHCDVLAMHNFKQLAGILSQLQTLKLNLKYPWLTRFPRVDGLRNLKGLELRLIVWDCVNSFNLIISLIQALPSLHKFAVRLFWSANFDFESPCKTVCECQKHPNLRTLELVGFVGCNLDKEIVKYLIGTAVSLKKFAVQVCHRTSMAYPNEMMTTEEREVARQCARDLGKRLSPKTRLLIL